MDDIVLGAALETARAEKRTRPQAVIFDWDNTLVETWPAIHEALRRTFEQYGREPWTFEETKQRVRKSMRESFPPLFGDVWEEAGAFFKDAFTSIHLDLLKPAPGAAQMLADLCDSGFYLGVVSNKNGDVLRDEAAFLGWQNFFGKIVGALDAEHDKPAADPVVMALSQSGIPCGPDVWFVGDTDVDLECAAIAGCVPVLVRSEAPGKEEFDEYPPDIYVNSCVTLSNLLRRL
ncbi:MAG: HAD family hydrolase [Rhodospirillales bacterium]|nr:HAD family hydrolase [Rhodospirillales bacterium]